MNNILYFQKKKEYYENSHPESQVYYQPKHMSKTAGAKYITQYYYPKIAQTKIVKLMEQLKPSKKGMIGGVCPQWCSGFPTDWSLTYHKYPIDMVEELGLRLIKEFGRKESNKWNKIYQLE